MESYIGANICDLVRLFLICDLQKILVVNSYGLYRNGGMEMLDNNFNMNKKELLKCEKLLRSIVLKTL